MSSRESALRSRLTQLVHALPLLRASHDHGLDFWFQGDTAYPEYLSDMQVMLCPRGWG